MKFLSGLWVPWFLLLILEKVFHAKIIGVHILVDWVNSCCSIWLGPIRFSQEGIKLGCAFFVFIPSEFSYMSKNSREIGYSHLLPILHSSFLVITVFLMILVQLILFGSMEWNSEVVEGLNTKQKLVASLFQVVNSRHTGESVFDLSTISPAVLVLFVVMMWVLVNTTVCHYN